MFLKNEFSNRLVQVSIFSAIVYYITAYPVVFEKARKYFPIKFKKDHHQLLFHTFVFAVLMYLLTYFVFDPVVRVVEGAGGGYCRYKSPDEKSELCGNNDVNEAADTQLCAEINNISQLDNAGKEKACNGEPNAWNYCDGKPSRKKCEWTECPAGCSGTCP